MGNEKVLARPGAWEQQKEKSAQRLLEPLGADASNTEVVWCEVVWCGQLISCLPFSEGNPETSYLSISRTIHFSSTDLLRHLRCALEHDQG